MAILLMTFRECASWRRLGSVVGGWLHVSLTHMLLAGCPSVGQPDLQAEPMERAGKA